MFVIEVLQSYILLILGDMSVVKVPVSNLFIYLTKKAFFITIFHSYLKNHNKQSFFPQNIDPLTYKIIQFFVLIFVFVT